MTLLFAYLLDLLGFGALALSMQRHHRDLFGKSPSRTVVLVLPPVGCSWIGLALWFTIACLGGAIGAVAWFGMSSLAAIMVVLALTYAPQCLCRGRRP